MTKRETWGLAGTAAAASGVVAVGESIHLANGRLGTALPPFVMSFGVRADVLATVVAALVLAAVVLAGGRLVRRPMPGSWFAAALALASLSVGLAVNAMRSGSAGWSQMFDLGPHGGYVAKFEILAALPALSYGPRFMLDHFAELVYSQPASFSGHPPGVPLLLAWTHITTPGQVAALLIGALVLVAPATYGLARTLDLGERGARTAGLLAACSPALVLFGVSSTDALFALAGTVTATLLVSRRASLRLAGGLAMGVCAMLSWLLLAVAAWATLIVWSRRGFRAALGVAAVVACGVAGTLGIVAATTGYDPIGTLEATSRVYHQGIAALRPYKFWVFGSPAAFLLMAGVPISGAFVLAVLRRSSTAVVLAATLGTAAVLGFTKAEVERIWLPFVPLLCVAAAPLIGERQLRPVLLALAVQAFAVSLLFATLW